MNSTEGVAMTKRLFTSVILCVGLATQASAQTHTSQGAALGGLAGAITGGIIGHQNNETPEGALIGGAVGAIAGGLLGNAKDKQLSQDRYYQHQAWHQQQQQLARAVTPTDVVNMSRSGLSDSVIVNHIATNGVAQHLGTHDIINLYKQGVSENVIAAMQSGPRAATTTIVQAPPQPPTVVVRREYHVAPPRYVPRYPHHYYPPRPYPHWGHRH
jgi:gas vesicle protein